MYISHVLGLIDNILMLFRCITVDRSEIWRKEFERNSEDHKYNSTMNRNTGSLKLVRG